MVGIFIILQCILLLVLLVHDWLPLYPFNNLPELRKVQTIRQTVIYTLINAGVCTWALLESVYYYVQPSHRFPYDPAIIYALMTIGTLYSWWFPYFFGSSNEKKMKMKPYLQTHSVLPMRADNIRPNTMHIIVHLLIWSNLVIGLYLIS